MALGEEEVAITRGKAQATSSSGYDACDGREDLATTPTWGSPYYPEDRTRFCAQVFAALSGAAFPLAFAAGASHELAQRGLAVTNVLRGGPVSGGLIVSAVVGCNSAGTHLYCGLFGRWHEAWQKLDRISIACQVLWQIWSMTDRTFSVTGLVIQRLSEGCVLAQAIGMGAPYVKKGLQRLSQKHYVFRILDALTAACVPMTLASVLFVGWGCAVMSAPAVFFPRWAAELRGVDENHLESNYVYHLGAFGSLICAALCFGVLSDAMRTWTDLVFHIFICIYLFFCGCILAQREWELGLATN